MEVAAGVCALEHLDFNSLDKQQAKALLSFRCTTCHTFYPLTDLVIVKRKHVCKHCRESVRLYSSSSKFGKIRRNIFYRLLDLGIVKVINTMPKISRKRTKNPKRISSIKW